MATNERNPIAKAVKALSWLVETPTSEVGVRQMATALQLSPSNAHRLLAALVNEELVQQDAKTSRYSLGPELLRWAHLINARTPIRQVALEHMRRLVEACNETALLGVYSSVRQQMMFAATVESTHPLRYAIDLNRWIPVHLGATGLAIMAFLPEADTRSIIKRTKLAPSTSRSITEAKRLETELQSIRRRGYALSHGQRTAGAVGLAAPVFGSGGEVIGDIALTIPEQRFNKGQLERLVQQLLKCTAAVTTGVGGTAPA